MGQFNVGGIPDEDKEKLKEYLRADRGGMSLREWIIEKIDQDTKTEDDLSKITDFHDKYVRTVPSFYAPLKNWIAHIGHVYQDKEATVEFESRMRAIAKIGNRVYKMKDNKVRLQNYMENPNSVQFGGGM